MFSHVICMSNSAVVEQTKNELILVFVRFVTI